MQLTNEDITNTTPCSEKVVKKMLKNEVLNIRKMLNMISGYLSSTGNECNYELVCDVFRRIFQESPGEKQNAKKYFYGNTNKNHEHSGSLDVESKLVQDGVVDNIFIEQTNKNSDKTVAVKIILLIYDSTTDTIALKIIKCAAIQMYLVLFESYDYDLIRRLCEHQGLVHFNSIMDENNRDVFNVMLDILILELELIANYLTREKESVNKNIKFAGNKDGDKIGIEYGQRDGSVINYNLYAKLPLHLFDFSKPYFDQIYYLINTTQSIEEDIVHLFIHSYAISALTNRHVIPITPEILTTHTFLVDEVHLVRIFNSIINANSLTSINDFCSLLDRLLCTDSLVYFNDDSLDEIIKELAVNVNKFRKTNNLKQELPVGGYVSNVIEKVHSIDINTENIGINTSKKECVEKGVKVDKNVLKIEESDSGAVKNNLKVEKNDLKIEETVKKDFKVEKNDSKVEGAIDNELISTSKAGALNFSINSCLRNIYFELKINNDKILLINYFALISLIDFGDTFRDFHSIFTKHLPYLDILEHYAAFVATNNMSLPIHVFLDTNNVERMFVFYKSYFGRVSREQPGNLRMLSEFIRFIAEARSKHLLPLLNLVPYVPAAPDILYSVFEIYHLIFVFFAQHKMHLFFLKTPAVTNTCFDLIEISDIDSIVDLLVSMDVYNNNKNYNCFLAMVYYSEKAKLSNFNFSGIIEYLCDYYVVNMFKNDLRKVLLNVNIAMGSNLMFCSRYLEELFVVLLYDSTIADDNRIGSYFRKDIIKCNSGFLVENRSVSRLDTNPPILSTSKYIMFDIIKLLFNKYNRFRFNIDYHIKYNKVLSTLKGDLYKQYMDYYIVLLQELTSFPLIHNYIVLYICDNKQFPNRLVVSRVVNNLSNLPEYVSNVKKAMDVVICGCSLSAIIKQMCNYSSNLDWIIDLVAYSGDKHLFEAVNLLKHRIISNPNYYDLYLLCRIVNIYNEIYDGEFDFNYSYYIYFTMYNCGVFNNNHYHYRSELMYFNRIDEQLDVDVLNENSKSVINNKTDINNNTVGAHSNKTDVHNNNTYDAHSSTVDAHNNTVDDHNNKNRCDCESNDDAVCNNTYYRDMILKYIPVLYQQCITQDYKNIIDYGSYSLCELVFLYNLNRNKNVLNYIIKGDKKSVVPENYYRKKWIEEQEWIISWNESSGILEDSSYIYKRCQNKIKNIFLNVNYDCKKEGLIIKYNDALILPFEYNISGLTILFLKVGCIESLKLLQEQDELLLDYYTPQLVQCMRKEDTDVIVKNRFLARKMEWSLCSNSIPHTMQEEDGIIKFIIGRNNELIYKNNIFDDFADICDRLMIYLKETKKDKTIKINIEINKLIEKVDNCRELFPFDGNWCVVGVVRGSGLALQSAAKMPFMVTFLCEEAKYNLSDKLNRKQVRVIFKSKDDCRQDELALQVITMFKMIFESNGLKIRLFPYKVIPMGLNRGIIEVVENAITRNQMGHEQINNIKEYFSVKFGVPGSPAYERALTNFISSCSGYSLVTYFLNIKDRHNGNILVKDDGHIVHIDYGFMLESSPGNLNIEIPIKLTTEIHDLIGDRFDEYLELMQNGFVALRCYADTIINLVESYSVAGLPCFRKDAINKLTNRFALHLNTDQAKKMIRKMVVGSVESRRTWIYDKYQEVFNDIKQ